MKLESLTLSVAAVAGGVTAAAAARTLAGPVVRWGEYGRTSIGRYRVKAGAITWHDDVTRVKLTKEHKRDESRGHFVSLVADDQQLHATARVSDGPEGDDALRDAADHTRDGFSFDLVDVQLEGDWIVSGELVAIGQVGIPAFDDMRIDQVAASQTQNSSTTTTTTKGSTMTDAEVARLAELRAKSALTAEEQAELEQLAAKEADQGDDGGDADAAADDGGSSSQATASVPAVPVGAGPRRTATQTRPRDGQALRDFVAALTRGLDPTQGVSITAALADVTNSGSDGGILSQPAWSGELWSGVQHEREFVPLLGQGPLTNFKGEGWRWVTKPEMKDYAGDKAAIPSDPIDTEPSDYEAARMAVGHDLDRKFYDFPDQAFLESYVRAVAESYSVKSDVKAHAWIVANAVPVVDGVTPVTGVDVLRAAGKALRKVKRNTRTKGTFVLVADDDFDTLMDVSSDDVPAFLQLFDLDPGRFTSSELLTPGTVIAGTKQAATWRELPGSPIRVSAQHIANGGVDEGFFAYWAVEQHHADGIVSVGIDATP